jgi:hypothetical protein
MRVNSSGDVESLEREFCIVFRSFTDSFNRIYFTVLPCWSQSTGLAEKEKEGAGWDVTVKFPFPVSFGNISD